MLGLLNIPQEGGRGSWWKERTCPTLRVGRDAGLVLQWLRQGWEADCPPEAAGDGGRGLLALAFPEQGRR